MTESTSPRAFRFFCRGVVMCLVAGFVYGGVEALLSLNEMKTALFAAPIASVPYRLLLGGAFFSQVFLLAWIGASGYKRVLSVAWKNVRETSPIAWAAATAILTGAALPAWVILNRVLPSVRSIQSIAGNAVFLIAVLMLLALLALGFDRLKKRGFECSAKSVVPVLVLETVLLLLLFSASNLPSLPEAKDQAKKESRPNIVLITIDALRADHLACYGYKKISTPNMDRLAAQGAMYENVLSPTSWTLPTFATLFTGVQQQIHGMNRHDVSLSEGYETVAESLAKTGYTNLAVVTNEFLNHPYKLDQGFDRYLFSRDPESYHPFAGLFLFDFLFTRKNERHNAENMTNRAISMLEKNKARPYFFWIHYIDPHTPYGAWYINRFPEYDRDYRGPLGREFNDIAGIDSGRLKLNDADKEHIRALYDAEILYTDRHVGRLLNVIEGLPDAGNTVVILTSDHGEEFWEHGDVEHGRQLFAESIHVPFLIRHPGKVKPGIRIKNQVGLIDLPPALCDLGGAVCPDYVQGQSILRFLEHGWETPVFVSLDKENPNQKRYDQLGIYDTEFSYILSIAPAKDEMLFETGKDSLQKKSVALEREDELDRMRDLLDIQRMKNQSVQSKLKFEGQGGRIRISPQMKESLRALGYIN